jgi:hypothetical protein
MTDDTRRRLSLICTVVGLAWWFGVEVWRGRSQEHSERVFWLHLTAPVVAIVLLLVAIWLLANTDRVRRARGLPPNPAGGWPGFGCYRFVCNPGRPPPLPETRRP